MLTTPRSFPRRARNSPGRRFLVIALLLTGLLPGWGFAQNDDNGLDFTLGGKKAAAPAKPKFTTTLTPQAAEPGDEVTLAIAVELPKGFYIYSTTGTFGGRTKIELETVGLEAIDAEFIPDHEPNVGIDPSLKVEVGKHFDRVTWSRKYRVLSDAKSVSVAGELNGMYCGGKDAENASCIPIRPAYQIAAKLPLGTDGVVPDAAKSVFSQHVANVVKLKGKETVPITFDINLAPPAAKPGDNVVLTIKATLAEGWHTFSLSHEGEGGLPTVIDIPQANGLKPLGAGFVADSPFEVEEQAGLRLEVHNHAVTWTREFEVTAESYGLSGEISYQVCKNVCLPLKTVAFQLGSLTETIPDPVGEPPVAAAGPKPDDAGRPAAAPKPPKALLPFLLLCFGGGFLALLTPCSFPMVPITVSFFLKQSEAEHKRPVLLALVYCGSIVAAFTILGVGIAALFGATKLNELANIPWLNLVIGGVFVLFALNMLGLFEIQMPGWLLTMTSSQESAGSYLGAVFMALTFTLTSFTCTFAIAGSLLVGAAQGEVYWPVIGMLAFGTAFAAPFFVLAMLPGLLKKLPKSGGWMNSVKVVMGLLEFGAAVKFFSIADPAQVFLDRTTVLLIWYLLAMVTAIYLFGWFKLPHDTVAQQISPVRMLLGIGFFTVAGLLMVAMTMPERGGFAVRQILAFAPIRIEAAEGELGPSLKHHGLEFALYLDKALPVAQKRSQPLLLDFTGVNCANCRDMENRMAQPEWKTRIAKFIGVQLYVDVPQIPGIAKLEDGKRLQAENIKLQDALVQDSSMPIYAVVSPDGKTVLATYIGAETVSGTFVKFLDEGWEKWEQFKAGKLAQQPAERIGKR